MARVGTVSGFPESVLIYLQDFLAEPYLLRYIKGNVPKEETRCIRKL